VNCRSTGLAQNIALAALFLPLPLAAQQAEPGAPFGISVSVNLVVLHASVHDRQGRDVLNLTPKDFALFEDGARQDIRLFRREDAPVTVGLVVDHSASMRSKMDDVTAAARHFAQSSNPKDDMFVINFNEKIFSALGRGRFTDKPEILEAAIARGPVNGRTALYDAIAAGLQQLDAGHWDKKVLVVISDGGDNESNRTLADITRLAEKSSASIFAVGIFDNNDPDAKPRVLKRLAESTGGEAFFPKQLNQIESICDHIANDIRNQYTIGYVSNSARPEGVRRSIRLTAGKWQVRTRSGYIAQSSK
jgi:Ca-activated chloride channel family protein